MKNKGLRTIIAGSRSITRASAVNDIIESCGWKISQVISGCAKGVDAIGQVWAMKRRIPVLRYPAEWRPRPGEVDSQAGMRRNCYMAKNADALIAVWDGRSSGTKAMINIARARGLRVHVVICKGDEYMSKLDKYQRHEAKLKSLKMRDV